MIRVIRTELRRSNAIPLVILLILASALVLAATMHQWNRQLLLFSYQQAASLLLLVPLALAGGATLGRRERRTRATELMDSTGRPRWQKVTPPAAALAVAVAGVHLLTLAVGATMIGTTGGLLNATAALPALVDITVLVGAVWLGFAAARAWPTPALPAALAALILVAQVAVESTAEDSRLRSLTLNLPPPGNTWESFTTEALLGRLALGAGLLLGGLLLGAGASRLLRAAGLAVAAAGVVLTVVITPLGPGSRYQVDAAAQRLVCADGTPQVCVTAVYAYELPTVTPAVRRALTLLAKLPGAPSRAVQWRADAASTFDPAQFRGTTPKVEPGTVLFRIAPGNRLLGTGDLFRTKALDPVALTANIVNGAGTTMNGCRLGDEVALGAAGAWLMDVDVLPLTDNQFTYDDGARAEIAATVRALRELPPQEQVRRVTALRDAANACRNDDLRSILAGEPTA
ncbi:hypothetical protein [Actinoplanes sp. NBRC 103695]|uniref:hypothetical protein n=1 Tax=Actinoplanes sp. NBRC 103695 TaxID=3032202 RepID=UPI0024A33407|nr:hypothetical protein [Actinoplanes sp. NBRC 103695]GLY92905.1 hypothetical protein Acsp02_01610 [Actinoplanes sp. NBRC 103695]